MMEFLRYEGSENRLYRLAKVSPTGKLADALQDEVERMLGRGYPKEVLYEDLKGLALSLRRQGREKAEDEVFEVMDVLAGWCAPSSRL